MERGRTKKRRGLKGLEEEEVQVVALRSTRRRRIPIYKPAYEIKNL